MRYTLLALLALAIAFPSSTSAIDLSRGIVLDVPDQEMEAQFGRIPPSLLTSEDSAAIAAYRFAGDTIKVLAILVEWNSRLSTYSSETIDSMIFSRNVYPGGSVADYFYEVSYGNVHITGDVTEWYNAGAYNSSYNFESLLPILDPMIDFSQYDGDHNGDVDAVIFVRSGTGQEDSHDPNDIWSYAMIYGTGGGPGPFDGVMVSRWNTSPEEFPLRDSIVPTQFSGVDTLNKIRVFCHELTHNLGLPDVYDYDDKLVTSTYYTPNDGNDHPFVDWCLMGYAGYGLLSIRCIPPTHLCGWSKKQLGWVDPIDVCGSGEQLTIYNLETHSDSSVYLIWIDRSEGEYFLLEYRDRDASGLFDKYDSDFSVYFWPSLKYGGDPLEKGLLISHVHDSLGAYYWRINAGLPGYPHYTVAVEDAGYNPSRDAYSNPEGFVTDSAQWWYPYETRKAAPFTSEVSGKEVFGPTTSPSSDGYYGPTGIEVRVDSIVGERLFATVTQLDSDGDGVTDGCDVCDGGDDTMDADLDGVPDFCDICAGFDDLLDADFDGVPDGCDICAGGDDSIDSDLDSVPDFCDLCPDFNDFDDADADTIPDGCDNCPQLANTDQANHDGDAFGDACDLCVGLAMATNELVITGDINADTIRNAADIIALVVYVFKSGPEPVPVVEVGDTNCDAVVNASDIIQMVTHVFKSGPEPCDVCAVQ